MTVELTRDQVKELLEDACPRCKEGWPLKWSNGDKQWFHEQKNAGNTRITICLGTNLRDKYTGVLNG